MNKILGITRFLLVLSTTAAVFLFGIQSISHALTLGFDDFVVTDGSPLDLNPAVGAVTYIGPIGSWTVNVTTGISKPAAGSAASPKLDLSSVNVTLAGEGHLRFWVVDSGFTGPITGGMAGPFEFRVGGTTDGIVSFRAFVNESNTDVEGVEFLVLGPYSVSAFSGTLAGSFIATGPFALGIVGDITHTGDQISSFNADLQAIPEPASLLLLGIGLIGLAGYGRKKFSKK